MPDTAYIATREEYEEIAYKQAKKAFEDTLPAAIEKATRKKWLTTDEVMEMLSCSRRHVQYLRDSGQLKYHQNGRTIRYHIEDVEAFLNGNKVQ